MIWWLMWT